MKPFSRLFRALAPAGLVLGLALFGVASAAEPPVRAVPPGNRSAKQPEVPYGSTARTAETGGTFDRKFAQVVSLLARDPKLIARIEKTAALYGVAPIHLVGAIVGEHTYNVDAIDSLQAYYLKAANYLGAAIRFQSGGVPIEKFVARPEFAACGSAETDYDLWSCREDVFEKGFRGKTVDGVSYPDDRFQAAFFQPLFAGQSFGLGQISPLSALMVSDLVHEIGGLPKLDVRAAPEVYEAIMNPDRSLHYMAALTKVSIDAYRDIARVDISGNPGITATLYNIGHVKAAARALRAANLRSPGTPVWPKENYYGWLVNAKLDELKKLLAGGAG